MWFAPYKGNKYLPGQYIHTYMARHVRYTILLFKTCMWHRRVGVRESFFLVVSKMS